MDGENNKKESTTLRSGSIICMGVTAGGAMFSFHRKNKQDYLICFRVMAPAALACSVATLWSEIPTPSDTWLP